MSIHALDVHHLVTILRGATDGFAQAVRRASKEQIQYIIDKADAAYYRPGMTEVLSDAEYDLAKLYLRELDSADERLTRVGAPYDPEEIGQKVKHGMPMGSLDNTDDGILGFDPWLDSMKEKLGLADHPAVMASFKVDGGSICATYLEGKLVKVATRGNGEVGEDITANAVHFRGLPTVLPKEIDVEVRGEAILGVKDYQGIRSRDLGMPFDQIPEADRSNPRNIGNGILGRHDGQDSDKIQFMAFNYACCIGPVAEGFVVPATEVEKLAELRALGFTTVPHSLCTTSKDLHAYYAETAENRPLLPFEIDGIVVVLNDCGHQKKFVTPDPKTLLRPKFARAIKFPHKSNTTVIEDVEVTIGHTRMVIPTAKLREVRIGGVNVSSALLNNYEEVQRLDIAIGDEVEVVLAGDIIPKIIRKVKDGQTRRSIDEPKKCPSCEAPTTRTLRGKEGACTYCSNPKCAAAVFAKLDCWIGTSKKGVGILDIGDSMIKALWDNGMLTDPADLYTLAVDQIKNVQVGKGVRIGTSRAEKIVRNIQDKKKLQLHTFLGSLGIELLGRRRVVLLKGAADGKLDRLEQWLDLDNLRTLEMPGYGDAIRAAVVQGIEENLPLITKLLANGVTIDYSADETEEEKPTAPTTDKPFAGLSFCFTGTRDGEEEVAALGGTLKSGVSKGLDFLVQKDPTSKSNKTKKAEELGTQVIGIDYLKRAIKGEVTLQKAVPAQV